MTLYESEAAIISNFEITASADDVFTKSEWFVLFRLVPWHGKEKAVVDMQGIFVIPH